MFITLHKPHIDSPTYIEHEGLWYPLTVIFTDDDEANDFLQRNIDYGVLFVVGGTIVIVANKDKGKKEV